jgi:hypothetical protein
MEDEGSLKYSQEPATEPLESSPHPIYLRYIMIFSLLCLRLSIGLLFSFSDQTFVPISHPIHVIYILHPAESVSHMTHMTICIPTKPNLQFKNSLATIFAEPDLETLTITLPNVMSVSRYLSCREGSVQVQNPV